MNKFPKHYSLIEEHPKHFMIHDARDNKAFQVSKSGLHPATQMHMLRLPKFSEGGQVNEYENGKDENGRDYKTLKGSKSGTRFYGNDKDEKSSTKTWVDQNVNPNMSMFKRYAEGGEAEKDDEYLKNFNAEATKDYDRNYLGKAPSIDDQAKSGKYANGPDYGMSPETPEIFQAATAPPPMMDNQAPADGQQPIQPQPVAASPQPQPSPQPQSNLDLLGGSPNAPTTGTLDEALGQEQAGIQMQAKGQMDQNKAMANVMEQHQALESLRIEKSDQALKSQQDQYNSLYNDVLNKKIDPDQYWEGKSKIGAALAVLAGGIGQGLSHSTNNMALDVIQNGISRSIDAQKADLGKKQSLLSDNLRIMGDMRQAENATRAQMAAMLQGKLQLTALQTGDPMLAGASLKAQGELAKSVIPLRIEMADHEVQTQFRKNAQQVIQQAGQTNGLSNADPSILVHGLIKDPADRKQAFEEIKNRTNIAQNGPLMMQALKEAQQEYKLYGVDSPAQKRLKQLMLPNFKTIDGTVRQAAMDESFHNIMPDVGDAIRPGMDASKAKTLKDWMESESATPVSDGYQIPLDKFMKTARVSSGQIDTPQLFVNKKTGKTQMGVMRNGRFSPSGG